MLAKTIAADDTLSRRAEVLTSIPGVAETTAAALIAEVPELGQLDGKAAASLAGLAPVARESGKWNRRSFIRGGRWRARRALFMATLTAIMRKLLVLANALLPQDRLWSPRPVPQTRSVLEAAGHGQRPRWASLGVARRAETKWRNRVEVRRCGRHSAPAAPA